MSAAFSAFMPAVLLECPGVSDLVAEQAVLRAATDFCKRSFCWSSWLDPIPISSGVKDYDIDVPTGAQLIDVKDGWLGSAKIYGKTVPEIARTIPNWIEAEGYPIAFFRPSSSEAFIRLVPAPTQVVAGSSLVVLAIYAPTPSAANLPDFLYSAHMDAIADGAKAILLAQVNQRWSNPKRAAECSDAFERAIGQQKLIEFMGNTSGNQVVTPRAFGD